MIVSYTTQFKMQRNDFSFTRRVLKEKILEFIVHEGAEGEGEIEIVRRGIGGENREVDEIEEKETEVDEIEGKETEGNGRDDDKKECNDEVMNKKECDNRIRDDNKVANKKENDNKRESRSFFFTFGGCLVSFWKRTSPSYERKCVYCHQVYGRDHGSYDRSHSPLSYSPNHLPLSYSPNHLPLSYSPNHSPLSYSHSPFHSHSSSFSHSPLLTISLPLCNKCLFYFHNDCSLGIPLEIALVIYKHHPAIKMIRENMEIKRKRENIKKIVKRSLEYKMTIIEKQIEITMNCYKKALEGEEFPDAEEFIGIYRSLWEGKIKLLEKIAIL